MTIWLATWLSLTALLISWPATATATAAERSGVWLFERGKDFPEITAMKLERKGGKLSGALTSEWYGEIPMQDLREADGKLVFRIDNGNPRLTPHDIVVSFEGDKAHLVGDIWYQHLDMTGRPGTARAFAALKLPTYELPKLRDLPDNGLARTPPMGWNSWNRFAEGIDDKTVRGVADALVSSGLREAGYIYINIDDGWQGERDKKGVLHPNPKFPDMKALADYVHAKGLKLGIYSSPGPRSCAGFAGSYGHIRQDARTWADWGIDYLKYDLCSGEKFYHTAESVRAVYQEMAEAIRATRRPIVFSLCEYGRFDVAAWGPKAGGNLWRTSGDISDDYKTMASIGFDRHGPAGHAGPGRWNDLDMLEVGNGGMSAEEYRTHMSLWALQAAPLIAGNDVRSMTPETLTLLTNREVIAVDQDPLGRQGTRLKQTGAVEVWSRPLKDGSIAVGLFNRSDAAAEAAVDWSELGMAAKPQVRDLWTHADLGRTEGGVKRVVPAHGVALLRVSP